MLDLQSIRESNSQLREGQPEFIAVMVGATSGIGEATCKELVRNVPRPTVYIVGRNGSRAGALLFELRAVNPAAQIHFFRKDVAPLENVDDVCKRIAAEAGHVNLLFLSATFI